MNKIKECTCKFETSNDAPTIITQSIMVHTQYAKQLRMKQLLIK